MARAVTFQKADNILMSVQFEGINLCHNQLFLPVLMEIHDFDSHLLLVLLMNSFVDFARSSRACVEYCRIVLIHAVGLKYY